MKINGQISNGWKCLALVAVAFSVFCLSVVPDADAAQIKRVIRGSTSFTVDDAGVLEDLTPQLYNAAGTVVPINLSKAVVFCSASTGANSSSNDYFACSMGDGATLNIIRGLDGVVATVEWFIVEFVDGVNVYSGSTMFAKPTGTGTQTKLISFAPAVDLAKTFVVLSVRGYSKNVNAKIDEQCQARGRLTSTTQLTIDRINNDVGNNGVTLTVEWQVVEITTNMIVQPGTVTMSAGSATATNASALSNFDPAKSFLVFNHDSGDPSATDGSEGIYEIRGFFSNSGGAFSSSNPTNYVTFQRGVTASSAALQISYYVVTFTDGSYSQNGVSGTGTPPSSTAWGASTGVGLTSIATAKSVQSAFVAAGRSFALVSNETTTTGTPATYKGNSSTSAQFASDTSLTIARTTADTAGYAYNAMELPPVRLISPVGTETLLVGTTYPVTWQHADSMTSGGTFGSGKHKLTVEVSVDSGHTTWTAISNNDAATTCDGDIDGTADTCNWKVPAKIDAVNLMTTTAKIRITDKDSGTTNDRWRSYSAANFNILGDIKSVQPSNVLWGVGDSGKYIQWVRTGDGTSFGDVDIDLDNDGDNYATTIVHNLTLANQNCTVDGGDSEKYNCQYLWNPSGSGVPGISSNKLQARVKRVSTALGTIQGVSPLDFEIRGSITIKKPANGDILLRGRTYQSITWCSGGTWGTGGASPVDIYYSTNSGAAYPSAQADVTPTEVTPKVLCTGGTLEHEWKWDWPIDPAVLLTTGGKVKVVKDGDTAEIVSDTGPDPVETGAFEIKAAIDLTSPPTSDGLRALTDKNISWSVAGGSGVTTVTLKYTTAYATCKLLANDNGCWTTITSGLGVGVTPFPWNAPNSPGTDVGILIHSSTPADLNLIFDKRGPYTLKPRIAEVTPPAAKAVLRVGTNATIQWDPKGSVDPVNVCLLKEGHTSCDYTIATGVTLPTKSASWTGIASTEMCTSCEIKVYDPNNPTAENSDGTGGISKKSGIFSVKGNITNAARDAASYNVGTPAAITWTATPTALADSVRIRYDPNSGKGTDNLADTTDDFTTILDTVAASQQGYTWNIQLTQPLVNGTGRIRVEYVGYGLAQELDATIGAGQKIVSDTLDFSLKGTLNLTDGTSPNLAKSGGVVWKIGQQYTIPWVRGGTSMGNINIKYSADGGTNWNLIATKPSADEAYSWCVGYNDGCSGTGGVAGSEDDVAHTPDLVISSDKNTTIKIRIESVVDPNGIKDCTGAGGNPCTDGTMLTIQKRFVNIGIGIPSATVLYVGEKNPVGESGSNSITWTSQGVKGTEGAAVKIRYDTDSGNETPTPYSHIVVDGISDAEGYHLWEVPNAIGDKVRVRIISNAAADVFGDMTSDFTIKGKITTTFPTTGSVLVIGEDVTGGIQYVKYGTLGNLEIIYNHSGYTTVITPGASPGPEGTSSATSFAWTVVATDSNGGNVIDTSGSKNSKFKLTGLANKGDATLEAMVETPLFQIRGDLYDGTNSKLVKEPGGGEVYAIGGTTQYIRWKARGNLGNLKVSLDTNAGKGVDNTVNTSDDYATSIRRPDSKCGTPPCYASSVPYTGDGTDGQGYYYLEWIVPNLVTSKARIRVESIANAYDYTNPTKAMATYAETSTNNFWIRPTVSVVSPNGVQTPHWKTSEAAKTVTVNSTGDAKLDVWVCYNNASVAWPDCTSKYVVTSAQQVSAGNTNLSWDVPAGFSTENAIIHAQWTDQATISDESNAVFMVKPVLTLTKPVDNTTQFVVGASPYSQAITWSAPNGSSPYIDILLSTNGGSTYPVTLQSNYDVGNGNADWTLDETTYNSLITKTAKIKIQKHDDTAVSSESTQSFYIKGAFSNIYVKVNAGDADPSTPIDLPIATTRYITWKYTGNMGTINAYYATDADQGSPTWIPIATCAGASIGSSGSGSCAWTIPNAPSANVKVKVENVTNTNWPDVSNVSSGLASIIGSISDVCALSGTSCASDNAGASMDVNGSKVIRWTPNGNISLFDIDYRVGDGSWSATPITGTNGVAGSVNGNFREWTWTNIPDNISNNVDFRVADHGNSTKVKCVSDDTGCNASRFQQSGTNIYGYILKGQLSIVSPIVTDVWTVGSTMSPSIRWSKYGSIGDLKIEYSATGTFTAGDYSSGDVYTIANNYSSGSDGNNDYAWPAGVIGANRKISDASRIRITNLSAPAGTELDKTSPLFKVRPIIDSIDKPTVATVWYATDTDTGNQTIDWVSRSGTEAGNAVPNCIVEYSTNGSDYYTVTGGAAVACGQGSHSLTWSPMADLRNATVRVRITYINYPGILETGQFSVRPKVQVTPTPDGNTKLVVGSTYNNLIKWTYSGSKANSKVEIRYDTGANTFPVEQTIATDVDAFSGVTGVTWTNVPSIIGTSVKVRVFDKDFPAASDDSPAFTVVTGMVFGSPQGSSTNVTASTAMDIIWTYTGAVANFDIYYSKIAGANAFPGANWVRIAQNVASATYCTPGTPNSCTYNWAVTGQNDDTVTNTASFYVNNTLDPANALYVSSEGTEFKRGAEVSNLTVFNGPYIPVGSTSSEIQWTKVKGAVSTTQMKIEYTNNAQGAPPTWNELSAGTDNDGSFIWPTVPGALADLNADVKLRITQVNPDNAVVTLTSSETFVIRAAITVTEPVGSGSESWGLLEDHDIKFTKKGAIQTVNIYYAPDGANYETNPINTAGPIDVSGLADNTVYTWSWQDIPVTTPLSTSGYSAKVKVRAETPSAQKNASAQGISGGGFQVRGSIAGVTPSANTTTIFVGDPLDIQWTPTGAIVKYKVEYSYATGSPDWHEITPVGGAAGVDAGGGAKKWTWDAVLDHISNNVLFRVSDYSNTNASAVSPSANYILGKLSITSPIVTDVWTVGSPPSPSIQWNKTGAIGDLKIEYSTTGTFTAQDYTDGNVFTIENAYYSGNDGVNNYAWSSGIIGANRKISDTSKIRITNLSAPAGTELDKTSAQFKIRPAIDSIDKPTTSTVWFATDTDTVNQTIEWVSKSGTKSGGVVPNCIVEYSTNGSDYYAVTNGESVACGQGSHSLIWSPMADLRSASVRTRVSYIDYPSINLEITPFSVRPKVEVTPTPDSNTVLLVGGTYANLVKWTYSGTTTNRRVEIRYDTGVNTFPPEQVIATDVAAVSGATGVTWTNVPDISGPNVKIRVFDKDFPAAVGDSPGFSVRGGISFGTPQGGVNRTADTALDISWTYTGTMPQFDIYYSVVSNPTFPGDYTLIADDILAATYCVAKSCVYNWVPGAVNDGRVLNTASFVVNNTLATGNALYASSTGTEFKRGAQVSGLLPANGQVITAGSTNTDITWTRVKGLSSS
ncbi:MAG: hypothetical protein V1673_02530, partial [Candidatus Omnitrophota bacterium]